MDHQEGKLLAKGAHRGLRLETCSTFWLMDPGTVIGTSDTVPRAYWCHDVASKRGLAGGYDRQDLA